MNKYLNENGLNKFWKRIKEKLDTKASKDDIKLHYTQARLYYTDSVNSEVVPPGTNLSMLPLENDSDYFEYNKTELIFKKTGTYEISADAFCENVGNKQNKPYINSKKPTINPLYWNFYCFNR